jgi:hypothetical protein
MKVIFSKINRNSIYIFLFLLILIFGLFLRVYHLDSQSYWIDESYSVNAALNIIEKGKPILDSGVNYSRSKLFHYPLALMIYIFGNNEYSTRILSVISGTIMIIVLFFLVKKVSGVYVALISSFLWAFLSLSIAWSRQSRMYAMFQLFFFLTIYLFLKGYDSKNRKLIYLSLLSLFISIELHPLGYVLFIIISGYVLIDLISLSAVFKKNINNFKKNYNKFLEKNKYLLLSFIGLAITLIFWRLDSIINVLRTESNYLPIYLHYFRYEFSLFFYLSVIGFFVIGSWKKRILYFLMFFPVLYLVTVHQEMLNFRYIFVALPVLCILTSYSLIYLINQFKRLKIIQLGLIILISLSIIFSGLFTFFPKEFYLLETETPQPDFKSAYNYISKNISTEDIIISSHSVMPILYLGKKSNYTFEMSLSRKPEHSLRACPDCSEDIYTNTSLIFNSTQLKNIIENNRGFLIIEDMTLFRISPEINELIVNQTLIYEDKSRFYSRIWVYQFYQN